MQAYTLYLGNQKCLSNETKQTDRHKYLIFLYFIANK